MTPLRGRNNFCGMLCSFIKNFGKWPKGGTKCERKNIVSREKYGYGTII